MQLPGKATATLKRTGLLVVVLRPASPTSPAHDKPSDRHSHFVLLGPEIDAPVEPTDLTPALRCVRGHDGFHQAVPLNFATNAVYTFGGNFVWSADSRFPSKHPIPIIEVPHSRH